MNPAATPHLTISAQEIAERITVLGQEVTEAYRAKPLIVVALMKGALYFAADLTRAIRLPLHVEFLTVSSYHNGTESCGVVTCDSALPDLTGRYVLLLDDILDTGLTLSSIAEKLREESGAVEVRTAVLLRKKKPQAFVADWVAFEIEDEYVVGYGLDHAQEYRNLPDISVLKL